MSIYVEKTDIGATLGTWLYCAYQFLYAAEQGCGEKAYISWPNDPRRSLQPHQDPAMFAQCPNMYEWWFKQPFYDTAPPRTETWVCEEGPPASRGGGKRLGDFNIFQQPLQVIKDTYRRYLKFNDATQKRIDDLVVKYGIDFDNTIGVGWRGCDSYVDGRPRLPIEVYFPFIDDILAQEPNLKIFATAEETLVTDRIVSHYPGRVFTIPEIFSAPWGYKEHSEYVNPASGYERGVQTCQLIAILSRCKYLIKNRSSVSSTACWLSYGKSVNIAHPENLGFGFDITKAEIDGKLVPLYR